MSWCSTSKPAYKQGLVAREKLDPSKIQAASVLSHAFIFSLHSEAGELFCRFAYFIRLLKMFQYNYFQYK